MTKLFSENLTSFSDYRDLFAHLFENESERKSFFSYEYCAQKIGVSKSYLKLLFQKKNHASIDKIHRICKLFNLSESDFQFVLILYLSNTTKDCETQTYFREVLSHMKRRERDTTFTGSGPERVHNSLLTKWSTRLIVTLAAFEDFKFDLPWVKRQLVATVEDEELKDSLKIVQEEGFLNQETIPKLKTSEFDPQELVMQADFLRAKNLIKEKRHHDFPVHCSNLVIPANEETTAEMIKILDQARTKIWDLSHQIKKPDRVLFIMNSLFTVAARKND